MDIDRTGFIIECDGRLYVRISYADSLGKRRELMRRAQDRKRAKQLASLGAVSKLVRLLE
jgi:hypothetical protein